MRQLIYITTTLLIVLVRSAYPSVVIPDHYKSRYSNPDGGHLTGDDDYDNAALHDYGPDHKEFLGEGMADQFDNLPPRLAKQRLGVIYDRIDTDKDSQVTEEELTVWIQRVYEEKVERTSNEKWHQHEVLDNALTFQTYVLRWFGPGMSMDRLEKGSTSWKEYRSTMQRERRRWDGADHDKSGDLTLEEFTHFMHPDFIPHLKEIIIDETFEDLDDDDNGLISLAEYTAEVWPASRDHEKPDWVIDREKEFNDVKDTNKDGSLDRAEVSLWLYPPGYEHTSEEARHLIRHSDDNKDGSLSKDEVINNYEVFVGSKATDNEEILHRHDEF